MSLHRALVRLAVTLMFPRLPPRMNCDEVPSAARWIQIRLGYSGEVIEKPGSQQL